MKKKLITIIDRLVLSFGVALMISLAVLGNEFRTSMTSVMDNILDPLLTLPVYIVIFILAAVTGVYSALIQKYTMNWELIHNAQDRMKEFQIEFKEAKSEGNKQKLAKLEERRVSMMGDQSEMMKQQFKPMFYISAISLPLFIWMYNHIQGGGYTINFPLAGVKELSDGILGPFQVWLVWYILVSILVGQLIRKALDVGGR